MFSRITFLVFLVFWLAMTYLLWRSEYGAQNQPGSTVPASLVWRKILSSPDASSMQVLHDGKKMGYCRWSTSVGQDLSATRILTDDSTTPDGATVDASGTRLDLEGKFLIGDSSGRLQVHGELRLTTNNDWQEFSLRIALKPNAWEIHSLAREQTLRVEIDDEQGKTEKVVSFADLQNPQALMKDFDVPAPLGMLGLMGLPGHSQKGSLPDIGLEWKARNDWVSFGHTSVRAFRLEASVLKRYRMRISVSRVGEILRVELPDGWELVNDQLVNL